MKRICLFCGSNPGARPVYAQAARDFGRALAQRQLTLVYGGGSVGLMKIAAESALEAGGDVIGVITEQLMVREVGHPGLTELKVVPSMHERKALMAGYADAFVALPGGFGTFDELFESVTLSQTRKVTQFPIVLFGTEYWNPMITWLKETVLADGYINDDDLDMLHVTDSVEEAVQAMLTPVPAMPPRDPN
jgi:hypothetical protein